MNNDFVCACAVCRKNDIARAKGKFMLPGALFRLTNLVIAVQSDGKRNNDLIATSFNCDYVLHEENNNIYNMERVLIYWYIVLRRELIKC